jgi:FkbM family methyltransferase
MLDNLAYRWSQSRTARRFLTPLLRTYLRYCPIAAGKEALWTRVVNPYFAWHSRPFVARTVFGPALAGDTRDMIQQYIYFFGIWEPELTAWIAGRLAPGDTFIDVGANIGYYSLLASKHVGKSGRVIGIEASPAVFKQLHENVTRNRLANVQTVNVAVSDRKGVVQLFRGPDHNVGETSLFQGEGFEPGDSVASAPLEEIVSREDLAAARLIKIDIEGAERFVVPALAPILRSGRADLELIVEFHPQYLTEPGQRADDLIQMMNASGFYPYRLQNAYWPFNGTTKPGGVRPKRLHAPIQEETVIIFSRKDAESL